MDLLHMAIEDKTLLQAWGQFGSGDHQALRQHLYVNLIVSQWQMAYAIGDLRDYELGVVARELFSGEAGRRYWRDARIFRLDTQTSKPDRRFHRIVDDEWQRAELMQES